MKLDYALLWMVYYNMKKIKIKHKNTNPLFQYVEEQVYDYVQSKYGVELNLEEFITSELDLALEKIKEKLIECSINACILTYVPYNIYYSFRYVVRTKNNLFNVPLINIFNDGVSSHIDAPFEIAKYFAQKSNYLIFTYDEIAPISIDEDPYYLYENSEFSLYLFDCNEFYECDDNKYEIKNKNASYIIDRESLCDLLKRKSNYLSEEAKMRYMCYGVI